MKASWYFMRFLGENKEVLCYAVCLYGDFEKFCAELEDAICSYYEHAEVLPFDTAIEEILESFGNVMGILKMEKERTFEI